MGGTVLVLDDDKTITFTLSNLIKIVLKYDVITSNDPYSALELEELANNKIDVIISDFIMPGMNGLEFLRKAKSKCPDAVIMMMTGYADKDNAIKSINELDLYYYLEKPWDNNTFIKVLKNGMEKKHLSQELKDKYAQLENSNAEIERLYKLLKNDYRQELGKNEVLSQLVDFKTTAFKNLLDNANQGFLTFGDDLLVDDEYSLECVNIFGREVKGLSFTQLTIPNDDEERALVEDALVKILRDHTGNESELLLPLLPDKVCINGKTIQIRYKIINDAYYKTVQKILAILTDLSEKDALVARLQSEKSSLNMIVKVVTNYNDFNESINDCRYFVNIGLDQILNGGKDFKETCAEVFRKIHTLKGDFGIYYMQNTVNYLHSMEDNLFNILRNAENKSNELNNYCKGLRIMEHVNEDLSSLQNVLQDYYYKLENTVAMDKFGLMEVEEKMLQILSPYECIQFLPYIQQYKNRSMKEMLSIYSDYITGLSNRLGKLVLPLNLDGDDILVDCEKFKPFVKSLVHVFRNAVDHGIETPEERLEQGKNAEGNIYCNVHHMDGSLIIKVSDDGAGINANKIRQKAVEAGIYSETKAFSLSDDEIIRLVFTDNFSTREGVTEFSGRGIGLAAVKEEIGRLEGTVAVSTIPEVGTEFVFTIPYETTGYTLDVNAKDMLDSISKTAVRHVVEQTGSKLVSESGLFLDRKSTLELKKYNVFVHVKGVMNGTIVFIYEEGIAQKIFESFCSDIPHSTKDNDEFFTESLMEFANIVAGNSMSLFRGMEDLMILEKPFIMNSVDSTVRYPSFSVWRRDLAFEEGTVNLGFILYEDVHYTVDNYIKTND